MRLSQSQVQTWAQGNSEALLPSSLLLVIPQSPTGIEGFHSDSGAECVNGKVATGETAHRTDQIALVPQQRQRPEPRERQGGQRST